MMAAEVDAGETKILAEDRQVTRLGESVFQQGRISAEALDFLCATLSKMYAVYSRVSVVGVRAVATSAVRDAGNQDEFLRRTAAALNTNVEIISGAEEARLIHMGVESRWPRPKERTLIIDVGGGSAELIISQSGQLIDAVSKPLGAVRLTSMFMKTDPPRAEELHRMTAYIEEKLGPFRKLHGTEKFARTVVTSATAGAIVAAVNGVGRNKREDADRMGARLPQVRELYEQLTRSTLADRRKVPGIGPRRAEIVIAGTAVFLRSMETLDLKSIYYSVAGVRDGIIADLAVRGVGRELSQLSKEQRTVVEAMARKYAVNLKHARHVATIGHKLFELLQRVHALPPDAGKLIEAAGYLHDIGHFISDTSHHKHSAYLVANSDMPGFTDKERLTLAALCRFHRKSMPQARHSHFQALASDSKRVITALAPLLRIADSLDRGHEQKVRDVSMSMADSGIAVLAYTDGDADLEIWAANEVAKTFRDVYGTPITIQRAR
jgi:exopolyphosphatase/guanosine-5'-triphosphate,3'-diphosphate pyrophosphatase